MTGGEEDIDEHRQEQSEEKPEILTGCRWWNKSTGQNMTWMSRYGNLREKFWAQNLELRFQKQMKFSINISLDIINRRWFN
jgi:hypothetical protein